MEYKPSSSSITYNIFLVLKFCIIHYRYSQPSYWNTLRNREGNSNDDDGAQKKREIMISRRRCMGDRRKKTDQNGDKDKERIKDWWREEWKK